jgi:hypothetical protein
MSALPDLESVTQIQLRIRRLSHLTPGFLAELEHISAELNRGIPNVAGMSESCGIDSMGAIDAETLFFGLARACA